MFGKILYIFNRSAVVLFDMSRKDNILSGFYLAAKKNAPSLPVEFRGGMERVHASGQLTPLCFFASFTVLRATYLLCLIFASHYYHQTLVFSCG